MMVVVAGEAGKGGSLVDCSLEVGGKSEAFTQVSMQPRRWTREGNGNGEASPR